LQKAHPDIFILKNSKAYEHFFSENYNALCRFAYNYLKDRDEAEEMVQSTFVSIWQKRKDINLDFSLKSYFYSSVKNSCLNLFKHQKSREKYAEDIKAEDDKYYSTESEIYENELKTAIGKALQKLPKQQQAVFKLSRFDGKKYQEIAEQLNISAKTVENHMGKAIKYMRTELQDYLVVILFIFYLIQMGDF
jgi:RNA polymerase sigma-70 factor (ECF subfamily)